MIRNHANFQCFIEFARKVEVMICNHANCTRDRSICSKSGKYSHEIEKTQILLGQSLKFKILLDFGHDQSLEDHKNWPK
jgi:hypothetical protein